jgi:hypothetical protein
MAREKIVHSSYTTFFQSWRKNPLGRGEYRGRASFANGVFWSYRTVIGRLFPERGVYLSTTYSYSNTVCGQRNSAESAMRGYGAKVLSVPELEGDSTSHARNEAYFRQGYAQFLAMRYISDGARERFYLKGGELAMRLEGLRDQMAAYSQAFDLAWSLPDAEGDAARKIAAHFDPKRQARLAASREKARKIRERKMMVEMIQGKRAMGDTRPRRVVFGERMVHTKYGWMPDDQAA